LISPTTGNASAFADERGRHAKSFLHSFGGQLHRPSFARNQHGAGEAVAGEFDFSHSWGSALRMAVSNAVTIFNGS